MKRTILFLILFVLICGNLIAAPSMTIEYIGSQAQKLIVTATNTLPVSAVISMPVGTATSTPLVTDEYGNTAASTTHITLSATPVAVTTLANRRDIAMIATGVWQCYIGTTTTPVASGTDLYDINFSCGPETPILVGTNATATKLTVYQQGRP